MPNRKKITTFQVAATYIGTVVGAGFATGQEILQFFGYYGVTGILGLILAGALLAFYGIVILQLGLKLQADSHLKVIHEAGGKWLGTIIDGIITFFLFGALVAMAAGAGAIFQEQMGLSVQLGSILMIIAALVTVLLGFSGVITAISIFVPVLLVAIISISVYSLAQVDFNLGALQWANPTQATVPFWPFSAVVYVSYNLIIAIAVLAPLGKEAKDSQVLKRGGLWGGIGLGLGAIAIQLTLLANAPNAIGYAVPMAVIANNISPLIGYFYIGVLLSEIYTTAVGSLYGFVVRLTSPKGGRYKWYAAGVSVLAFAASQFGFTNLVRILYPAVGYAGLAMIAGLTWILIRPAFVRVPSPAFKPLSNKKDNNRKK